VFLPIKNLFPGSTGGTWCFRRRSDFRLNRLRAFCGSFFGFLKLLQRTTAVVLFVFFCGDFALNIHA